MVTLSEVWFYCHDWEHCGHLAGEAVESCILIHRQRDRHWPRECYWHLEPAPSTQWRTSFSKITHSLTRTHLLVISKYFLSLITKHSNISLLGALIFKPPHAYLRFHVWVHCNLLVLAYIITNRLRTRAVQLLFLFFFPQIINVGPFPVSENAKGMNFLLIFEFPH